MSVGKRYALDANVLIQAHRQYYALDICPGFWTALLRRNRNDRVVSIDRIRKELARTGDESSTWVKDTAPAAFFKKTSDQAIIQGYHEIMNWVNAQDQYDMPARVQFARGADAWLIAFGRFTGDVIVTHEVFAPDVKRKVPIPNVCVEFGAAYCNTFEMIRAVEEQFVLKTRRKRR